MSEFVARSGPSCAPLMSMYKSKVRTQNHQAFLMASAGLVSAFIFLSQFNIQEVLRFDRLEHTLGSMGLFFVFYFLLAGYKLRWTLSVVTTLMIGLGKEWMDHQMQSFDLYANFFGVVLALMILVIALGFHQSLVKTGQRRRY
jgi:hypothetical protein